MAFTEAKRGHIQGAGLVKSQARKDQGVLIQRCVFICNSIGNM
jgi:hypothetical protein